MELSIKKLTVYDDDEHKKVKDAVEPICPTHKQPLFLDQDYVMSKDSSSAYHLLSCPEDGCSVKFYVPCCQG
jgi:hypothetical protein